MNVAMDWILMTVIALLLIAFVIGFMIEFPAGHEASYPRRCPLCGLDGIAAPLPVRSAGGLRLDCRQCGAHFREEPDGSLSTVTPS
jgi:hypothetical protein